MSIRSRRCSVRHVLAVVLLTVLTLIDRSAAADGTQISVAHRSVIVADPAWSVPTRGRGSDSGDLIRIVINRAMAQRGIRYSWGGGNAAGPTTGVRDGGTGDSHGDYRTVGFDCSGLMIYTFAPVLGYSLPHYSGSQYHAGRRVPLALKRPGDLLFWGSGGRIHHVALYVGNEKMIEAAYSGSVVRVTAVRYGGIMPYVTRIL